MYTYWVDLGIVVLQIISEYECTTRMLEFSCEKPNFCSKDIVKVYMYDTNKYEIFPYEAITYREKIMQSGVYIGHHMGLPIKMKIVDKNEIHLCAGDYNRILWSYIVKFVLTVYCIEKGYLHLKGGAVEFHGKVFLIVGRGGSGKTELIKTLCGDGASYITNTHAIIDDNMLLGVKSNVRIRNKEGESYYSPLSLFGEKCIYDWKRIDGIIWIKYRTDTIVNIQELSVQEMHQNMRQFSEAIVNWELHEDIYDFYNSNPIVIGKILQDIDDRLYRLIKQVKNYFVNMDIKTEVGKTKLESELIDIFSIGSRYKVCN